ncbi:GNAT family N-acyltransferase [Hydrogenimonas thermophila]|uniref:lysophospholipid acyltransferase family protein n=1 Tax=Hydrogenimonas thermophila TaxID=223786 RepID=UPI002936DEE6|nr:GNAT family N-acyltransferase [Hydrogenimonas thermophila]WOE69398.1 GNAT family N-acyltransferase [Hydrogenimonas thermophila]WOE71907.1 GNAT family N-acyltransferase [Hydrogenimonas thermophila]
MAVQVEEYISKSYPSFVNYPKPFQYSILSFFKRFFHEDEINSFLKEHAHKDAFGFVEAVLDYFDTKVVVDKKEMARIPAYGKVVIIANHPLGALDALALIYLLQDIRKDIKVLANDFLYSFDNLRELLIPIDNMSGKMKKSSISSIYEALNKEEAVIIFPSGEVSRVRPDGIKDTKWQNGFYKIAKKAKAPILPIYIDAKNSKSFYLLSMINKSISTAVLPNEMFKFKNKTITFKIGKQIPYENYSIPSLGSKEIVRLLRKHFYNVAKGKKGIFKSVNEIALPEPRSEIKNELKTGIELGTTFDGKKIILYEGTKMNALFREIGRLREISFRQVGEGSGRKRDIDDYDFIYKHLIVWDDEELEIAGAYRVGVCKDIIDVYGMEGLYTSTLFNYDARFKPYLQNGIELGRSFVQPRYWNSRALDYLWQGIGAYLRQHPDIRYLFGPVSLSASFTEEAKALIVYFYTLYFGSKEPLVKHKEPFRLSNEVKTHLASIFTGSDYRSDMRVLKEELEIRGFSIPVLYKQYAEVCEEGGMELMDFGVDREFNHCIDGFIVVDLKRLKPSKRKRYIGETV